MIHLTRSVVVSSFDVEATVALGQDRPEFLAVARLAADLARPIGARDVLQELLGGLPDVAGRRVIERCVDLGLLERHANGDEATLSASGRVALEHGAVMVPEEGIWRFYVLDDPLVAQSVVHVERVQAESVKAARDAVKSARTRGETAPAPDATPTLLQRCKGAIPHPSVQDGGLFSIADVAARGAKGPQRTLRLTLTWDGTPTVHLTGQLGGDGASRIDATVAPPAALAQLSYEHLWETLVTQALPVSEHELRRWKAVARRAVVPVSFQDVSDTTRRSFSLDVDVASPEVQTFGRFDPATLKGLGVVPASDADAQAWLSWLQWDAISDYVTPEALERQAADQRARFPHHAPQSVPPAEILAKALTLRDERAWLVLAPSDLGLWSNR